MADNKLHSRKFTNDLGGKDFFYSDFFLLRKPEYKEIDYCVENNEDFTFENKKEIRRLLAAFVIRAIYDAENFVNGNYGRTYSNDYELSILVSFLENHCVEILRILKMKNSRTVAYVDMLCAALRLKF